VIVVGLGGNLGGPDEVLPRFAEAVAALAELGPVRVSAIYRTAPLGPPQPDYLNAAVAVAPRVEPTPAALASRLFAVERRLGRRREAEARWGARTVDLDVLLWDGHAGCWPVDAGWLEVPHPRLTQRRFALAPLADLLGAAALVAGRPLAAWLAEVAAQPVERTALALPPPSPAR
jgi:2-amino-4-hydroxy-6-hydroxymethyldihydropteridine diphosphokinase